MTVCALCGRKGVAGFVVLSGDWINDAGRTSWKCRSTAACERRQHQAFPMHRTVSEPGERHMCSCGRGNCLLR